MMPNPAQSLARIQTWMQAVIQHPGGVVEAGSNAAHSIHNGAASLTDTILPSSRQTSAERLQIYADAYFARLLEVLTGEFPALTHAVGEELFAEFALGYLQTHPSRSYTLGELGSDFPRHLAETRPPREADVPDWADFLIDCCRLERVYAEVFDGPGPEAQGSTAASTTWNDLSPEQFAQARLLVAPWVRLVELQFPAHEYISAVRRGESPSLPDPAATYLVVSRREYIVRRVRVERDEFAVLAALQQGTVVGAALEVLWEHGGGRVTPQVVEGWFAAWAAAGYFSGLAASPAAIPEQEVSALENRTLEAAPDHDRSSPPQ